MVSTSPTRPAPPFPSRGVRLRPYLTSTHQIVGDRDPWEIGREIDPQIGRSGAHPTYPRLLARFNAWAAAATQDSRLRAHGVRVLLAEYCDGTSDNCPADQTLVAGTPCVLTQQYPRSASFVHGRSPEGASESRAFRCGMIALRSCL